jgi:hypothetical protein
VEQRLTARVRRDTGIRTEGWLPLSVILNEVKDLAPSSARTLDRPCRQSSNASSPKNQVKTVGLLVNP